MKLLIYRYGSICEPDIIESFKRLGFEVDEENVEVTRKDITPTESISIVSKRLDSISYMFVFSINFFPWLSELCNIVKLPYITLIVDSPVLELYTKSITNACNRIFLFDKALYNEFAPLNPNCIFHVPLATNIQRNDRVIAAASDADKKKYSCDISFIGSTYEEKCQFNLAKPLPADKGYIDGIIEAQLKIYGYNFIEDVISDELAERFLKALPGSYIFPDQEYGNNKALVAQHYISVKVAEQERIRALSMLARQFNVDIYTGSDTSRMYGIHNKGLAASLTEMPIIFNQSKINLNITAKSIRSGLSLRIFDVLGCGGFLITNYQAELPEFFEIGTDLVAYESLEHLSELCAYYLEHEEERCIIAQNGYNKVKALHNYDRRLLQMLDMAFPAQS